MLLERFVNGRARSNAYVVAPTDRSALIVDAGHGAAEKIIELVRVEHLEPLALVQTHGHPDHIWTARELSDRFEIPAYIHPLDRPWFDDPATGGNVPIVASVARIYGRAKRLRPQRLRTIDAPTIDAGDVRIDVLHTPGHSRGSACFVVGDLCFAGDTVFARGIGQTAFPGGSRRTLRESIRAKLLPLPDDLRVLPGHGHETTVGAERGSWEAFTRGN